MPIVLGFSIGRLYIGEEAASEVDQGHHTIGPRGPGARHPRVWLPSGPPLALVWSSSFVREK
jgi:hypothetical protein